jgi:hypothetical protein
MRDEILGRGVLPGQRHNPSELVVAVRGALQERDEILDQEHVGRVQLALHRLTDRQQRVIQAIQVELISGLAAVRRCQVRVQPEGPVGRSNRQLMLAGARQGETREQ